MTKTCQECGGTGECPGCEGTGIDYDGVLGLGIIPDVCTKCSGTGRCPTCGGD